MLNQTERTRSNTGNYIALSIFPMLATIYKYLITFKVRKFISGICPKGRMAAIGKYRRNLIDFEENSRLIYHWAMFISVLMTVRNVLKIIPELSPVTMYWIAHGNALAFLWAFHGLFLPLTMTVPWKSSKLNKISQFYVHKPKLTPRQPTTTTGHQASTASPTNKADLGLGPKLKGFDLEADQDNFKCDMCLYECERKMNMAKHKNTKHLLPKTKGNSREDNEITIESPCNSSKSTLRTGKKHEVTVATIENQNSKGPGTYCEAKPINLAGRATLNILPEVV